MKKIIIVGFVSLLVVSSLIYSGCKKPAPYTTPPALALLGPNPYYLSLDSTYIEYGAVAHDDKDGDISNGVSWSGADSIHTLQEATYYVTYKVTNSTGLTSTVIRKVIVINNADFIAGRYHEADMCAVTGASLDTISTVSVLTTNDQIKITNFAGFGSGAVIFGTLNHLTDSIYFPPNQSLGSGKILLLASGTVVTVDTSFTDSTAVAHNLNINYSWSIGIGGNKDTCNAVYSNKY